MPEILLMFRLVNLPPYLTRPKSVSFIPFSRLSELTPVFREGGEKLAS
jgi:hypothetical protein